jgi:hypothetical protein
VQITRCSPLAEGYRLAFEVVLRVRPQDTTAPRRPRQTIPVPVISLVLDASDASRARC